MLFQDPVQIQGACVLNASFGFVARIARTTGRKGEAETCSVRIREYEGMMAGNETEASTRAIRRKFSRECLGKKSILTGKIKAHSSRVIRVIPTR
jgi:hypothetical protein